MISGRSKFSFFRILLLSVVELFLTQPRHSEQEKPVSSIPSSVPEVPASQAAVGTSQPGAAGNTPDHAASMAPKDNSEESSSLTLGPGDLIEVSVYNVPELASKVRVGNSGDAYLPLIDYVHVG